MKKLIKDIEKRIKDLQKNPNEINIALISELTLILKKLNNSKCYQVPHYDKMLKAMMDLSLIKSNIQEYKSSEWSSGFFDGFWWTIKNGK